MEQSSVEIASENERAHTQAHIHKMYSIYCVYSSYMSVINLSAEFTLISNVNSFPQMIFFCSLCSLRAFILAQLFLASHSFYLFFVFVICFSISFLLVCLALYFSFLLASPATSFVPVLSQTAIYNHSFTAFGLCQMYFSFAFTNSFH